MFEGLIPVACDNDIAPGNIQSAVTFPCTVSTIYYVAVDGVSGGTGTVALHYFLNRIPTISALPNTTINEDASTPAIPFTVGDAETAPNNLVLLKASSNTTLVPLDNIVLSGSDASRSIIVTPAPNQNGSTTITLTVTDANGASASAFFILTVNAVNDPPTLDPISDLALSENAAPQTIDLSGITSGAPNEIQTLSVAASSNNPALIPTPSVTYTSPNATGTLTLNPAPNTSGSAVITVTVSDGGSENATFARSFSVIVSAAKHPPTISPISNQFTSEDTPAGPIPFLIGDVETPASNLVVAASSSDQSLVPDGNIVLGGSNTARTVTITPASMSGGGGPWNATANPTGLPPYSYNWIFVMGDGGSVTNPTSQTATINQSAPTCESTSSTYRVTVTDGLNRSASRDLVRDVTGPRPPPGQYCP